MADEFVQVPIETDSQTLADAAIDSLRSTWVGWEPNDADLEVILVEVLAAMAQNAAETAARVPASVFRRYGTDLIGIPYTFGSKATTTTTWTLIDNPAGRIIPAGTEIAIDGYAFAVDEAQIVAAGVVSVVGVVVSATDEGAAANDLVGTAVSMVSALDWVANVVVTDTTAGGSDPENDLLYQDRLARELQLQAKTLVTPRDFEIMALSEPGVGRVVATHNGERAVDVTTTDTFGEPVSTAIKNRLIALFADYRLVNTVVTVSDPTYTTVAVAYTVKAYPGFDPVDLKARIDALLAETLSPANWGAPKGFGDPGTSGWFNETVVRLNKLIDLIGDVEGVNYVTALTINGAATDLALTGTTPLTRPGVMTGTIT